MHVFQEGLCWCRKCTFDRYEESLDKMVLFGQSELIERKCPIGIFSKYRSGDWGVSPIISNHMSYHMMRVMKEWNTMLMKSPSSMNVKMSNLKSNVLGLSGELIILDDISEVKPINPHVMEKFNSDNLFKIMDRIPSKNIESIRVPMPDVHVVNNAITDVIKDIPHTTEKLHEITEITKRGFKHDTNIRTTYRVNEDELRESIKKAVERVLK